MPEKQPESDKPEKKVSAVIQEWVAKHCPDMPTGRALAHIYRKFGWTWADIPRDRGNEVCAYLKSVSDGLPEIPERPEHFADEL